MQVITPTIWIGTRGNTDPAAAARSAKDLLAALDVAEGRIQQSYGETPTPVLLARLAEARKKLEAMAGAR